MTEAKPNVVVLGSAHMDLIASAARMPGRGESVAGGSFAMSPGGKAGNQACQVALAGARAQLISRLGDDMFGRQLLAAIAGRGVDVSQVRIDPELPTGASTILAAEGDYTSIIAPGAAARISAADIEATRSAIAGADALMLQLEVPATISAQAAAIASAAGKQVIFNASPAPGAWSELPDALRRAITILVVNRVEAGRLLGRTVEAEGAPAVLAALTAVTGVSTIVLTLGAQGSAAIGAGGLTVQPAFPAVPVDAVGAGDAFLGVLTAALLAGASLAEGLRRGAAAGALAVGRRGVYDALPTAEDVDAFLARVTARPER